MRKSIKAFRVRATRQGWNYPTSAEIFKTDSADDAIKQAKQTFKEEGMTFDVSEILVHHISDKLQNDSYPYGYLKTTAFFSIEYNSKKGCRAVFQTINPKNGSINKPKNSTYSPVILPCTIVENGHFEACGHLSFNGDEEINSGLRFMSNFYECFEPEQIKDIALYIIGMSKINAKAQVIYCGTEWDVLKPLIEPSIKNLVEIAKTGENLFLNSLLDVESIKALKKPDFNPFVIKEYSA